MSVSPSITVCSIGVAVGEEVLVGKGVQDSIGEAIGAVGEGSERSAVVGVGVVVDSVACCPHAASRLIHNSHHNCEVCIPRYYNKVLP